MTLPNPVQSPRLRRGLLWTAVAAAALVPLVLAATSPLLAWRSPVYIAAGLAGVLGMALMLFQPLLAAGQLPGLPLSKSRFWHRWIGGLLLLSVALHVAGLWATSPPDVIDALTFRSPTPFSDWGVIAMWALFAAAILALLRRRLPISPRAWRRAHTACVAIAVCGTGLHALLIEGTMETVSKIILATSALAATAQAVVRLGAWRLRRSRPS